MATRFFKQYKFLYDKDNGQQLLKVQRSYRDDITNEELTPITPLFLQRVISVDFKIDKSDFDMRKIVACRLNENNQQGFSQLTVYSPYAPADENLRNHIKEILNYPQIKSGEYFGETGEVVLE